MGNFVGFLNLPSAFFALDHIQASFTLPIGARVLEAENGAEDGTAGVVVEGAKEVEGPSKDFSELILGGE